MEFKKIQLNGFKSFAEKTNFLIEEGLTGIVGPNGCGKSNIVESLRWVMGETSAKSMRGSGMEDVIFSGTSNKASKNIAEVSIEVENKEKEGPIQYRELENIQVRRKIEKDKGSKFYINDKEVRARDAQMFFADLSTGAHSPSMISQGRIGALVTAKPTDRRAILEEAAGISGLHVRRHEAELRLGAAENNLKRAVELMPDDPIVNDHYGDILWKLDQKIQARYFWNSVLSFDDTEDDMRENINKKLITGLKSIQ